MRLEAGSVLRWMVDFKEHNNKREQQNQKPTPTNPSDVCLQIPRLLFGAVEHNATDTNARDVVDASVLNTWGLVRNHQNSVSLAGNVPRPKSKMETLRWKVHAAPDDPRNYQQKVILDLLRVPEDDEMWGNHVYTVHRPSRALCAPEAETNRDGALLVPPGSPSAKKKGVEYGGAAPVAAFHYIGSEERYFSRPDDFRRNPMQYRKRSNITYELDYSGWIDQWLERFVDDVGMETASELLSTYVLDEEEI